MMKAMSLEKDSLPVSQLEKVFLTSEDESRFLELRKQLTQKLHEEERRERKVKSLLDCCGEVPDPEFFSLKREIDETASLASKGAVMATWLTSVLNSA